MKLRIAIALLIVIPAVTNAQLDTVGQYVTGTAGDHFDQGTFSMSFTIGEPVIATIGRQSLFLTQGFHQEKLLVSTLEEVTPLLLNLKAYPNPTGNFLYLDPDGHKGVNISMRDMRGREILNMESQEELIEINLEAFPVATYLLCVNDAAGNFLKAFKVQKFE